MSHVFLAEEVRLGRQVVLKLLPPETGASVNVERFEREIQRVLLDAYELAPALKRSGELYEARGDRAKAADRYRRFVDLWKNADPELQPGVREVRARLARLSTESPS